MSKFDNILKAVKVGSGVGKLFVPGSVGKILDVVNKGIADTSDPANEAAIKALATELAEHEKAILALHERVKALEAR